MWFSADIYCRTREISGETGWHLPSALELVTLVDEDGLVRQGGWPVTAWASDEDAAPGYHVTGNLANGAIVNDNSDSYLLCVK